MKWIVFWVAINFVSDPCPQAVESTKRLEEVGIFSSGVGITTCAVIHGHFEHKKMSRVFHNKDSVDNFTVYLKELSQADMFGNKVIDSIKVIQ